MFLFQFLVYGTFFLMCIWGVYACVCGDVFRGQRSVSSLELSCLTELEVHHLLVWLADKEALVLHSSYPLSVHTVIPHFLYEASSGLHAYMMG